MRYFMYAIYKALRFCAVRSNGTVSSKLWSLWLAIGKDYADGLLTTGKMQKFPHLTSIDSMEDLELEIE